MGFVHLGLCRIENGINVSAIGDQPSAEGVLLPCKGGLILKDNGISFIDLQMTALQGSVLIALYLKIVEVIGKLL